MPRREVLTPADRARLVSLPEDPGELIRLSSLGDDDLAFIGQHRGEHNRLGVAAQLIYLRFPGRSLGVGETPDPTLLSLLASQLRVSRDAWAEYARRDKTRREHFQEIMDRLGLTSFAARHYRDLVVWLVPTALHTADGWTLASTLTQELRRRRILLPAPRAIDRLCAEALTRAEREMYRRLLAPLTEEQRAALEGLLAPRQGSTQITLTWMRMSAAEPSPSAILKHIERLEALRALGLPATLGHEIPRSRLDQLARCRPAP